MRALVATLLLLPTHAFAATLRVGLQGTFTPGAVAYNTLTDAIAAAANGDVIEVGNGTWAETLTISNKRLVLRSVATGGSRPVLQTAAAQPAMTVTNRAVVTFEGLQWTSAGGRRCMRVTSGADVVLDGVRFQDCVHNDSGAALYVSADSSVEGASVDFAARAGLATISVTDRGGGFIWAQGDVTLEGGSF
ncbi:MAG TPA: hypothetical protein PKA64_24655, partial [Myxococcota bacterium]|nr:hypothetical protein [Myxococcota bacterium]